MKNISTLLALLASITALIHVEPTKAELSTVIDFDSKITFDSKFKTEDRLKNFDMNQDFFSLLSYSNSSTEGTISLSKYYPMVDNTEVFNAFNSITTSF